jgi:hypothetical protein
MASCGAAARIVSAKMVIPRWSCDDGSKRSDDNVSGGRN